MNKIQEKFAEWAEALFAPFVAFLYRGQLSALADDFSGFLAERMQLARIWWHYSLPGRVRPWLRPVLATVLLSWIGGSFVFWNMHVPEAGSITYWCWTAFQLLLAIRVAYEDYRLGRVKPISRADLEQLEVDTANMSDADAKALREVRFGPMRVLGLRSFALAILGYALNGVGFALMGSFSNMEGNPWPVTGQFILVAIIMAFTSVFIAMLTAVVLGTVVRTVGSILIAFFKGGWDSVLTMLPNVEGEEAKELLNKNLDKEIAATWKLFRDFMVSAPGLLLLGVFALGIVWHHPLIVAFLLLAFIGLMSTTTFSIAMGNDESFARKRAGKLVSWFFIGGFLYRCAEMWYFGLPGGTWYWNYDSVERPLYELWNHIVPWWNGFMGMSWWKALLVIVAFAAAITGILKLPDNKWANRLKYGLVGICGLGIAATVIGFVANRVSVDATIATVEVPAVATVETPSEETPTERAPDSIDRMTGRTAEAPAAEPVVAAPVAPIVEPPPVQRVEAIAPPREIPRDRELTREERCRALDRATPDFRERMRERYHCS